MKSFEFINADFYSFGGNVDARAAEVLRTDPTKKLSAHD